MSTNEGKNQQIGITDYVNQLVEHVGKKCTIERLKLMQSYAKDCIRKYPKEKSADVLGDILPILDSVIFESEKRLGI